MNLGHQLEESPGSDRGMLAARRWLCASPAAEALRGASEGQEALAGSR